MKHPLTPGVCRFCGCTDANRCRVYSGDECGWLDKSRTACTAPNCMWALNKMPNKKLPRKKTPADIHALIRGRGRKQQKKAGVA